MASSSTDRDSGSSSGLPGSDTPEMPAGERAKPDPDPAEAFERVAAPPREEIEEMVGGPIGNTPLYWRALTHRSVLREEPDQEISSNERLEFLGDAVLGLVVADYLYAEFPEEDEGFLTKVRSKLVNNKQALARFARLVDLGDRLILSKNMDRSGGRSNPSILADALEALIGAIYLDRGLAEARVFIEHRIFEELDLGEVAQRKQNYKSLLQETVQGRGWTHPEYRLVSKEGPSHRRQFTVEVLIEGEPYGTGTGRSKKKAEQNAAAQALEKLREQAGG